jgi:hypothetical protein
VEGNTYATTCPLVLTRGRRVVTILTTVGLESAVSDDLARKRFTELKERAGQRLVTGHSVYSYPTPNSTSSGPRWSLPPSTS